MLAQPVHLQEERLGAYLHQYRSVFSLPQWKYFVTILLGLLHCDERRTMRALLRHLAVKVTVYGLCYFLSKAGWSIEELTAVRQRQFYQRIAPEVMANHTRQRAEQAGKVGRPPATLVTGYLIFDDSTHAKRYAREQEGLGRHYSGVEKKVVQGHSLVQGLYLLEGQEMPLTPQMYRSQADCRQQEIPFQSKVEMVYTQLTNFTPAAETHTHVLWDGWYMSKRNYKAARKRGWDVSGGIPNNRIMRLLAENGERTWLPIHDYAATLTANDFQAAIWPRQEEEEKQVYVHLITTWIRGLGPVQLLIVKGHAEDGISKMRFFSPVAWRTP